MLVITELFIASLFLEGDFRSVKSIECKFIVFMLFFSIIFNDYLAGYFKFLKISFNCQKKIGKA